MGGAQLIQIGAGAGDGQHARRMDAVATGVAARCQPVRFTRHHVAIQQRDNAGERAHPARRSRGLAGRAPAHGFGPGEIADDLRDHIGQYVSRRPAFAAQHGEQHDALARVAFFQLIAGQPGLFQKAVDGLRRGRGCRALHLFRAAGAGRGDIISDQPQPARGGVCRHRPVRKASGFQRVDKARAQLLGSSSLHACRNFFGLELEKELAHAACSTQISDTAFTRSRTRPI